MARLTIAAAARSVGLSRQHLYRGFINKGLLSVSRDTDGTPYIDSSELIRTFGDKVKSDTGDSNGDSHQVTQGDTVNTAMLHLEVTALRQQLSAADEREKWLRGQVEHLTTTLAATTRLLEHRPAEKQVEVRRVIRKRSFLWPLVKDKWEDE